jgi:hypothetical protein
MGWRGSQYGGLEPIEKEGKGERTSGLLHPRDVYKGIRPRGGEKAGGGEAPLNNRNDFGESRSWNGDGKVEWTSQSLGPKI